MRTLHQQKRSLPGIGAILLLGVACSITVWQALTTTDSKRVQSEFYAQAARLETAIKERVTSGLLKVNAVAGLYSSVAETDRDQFRRFTEALLEQEGPGKEIMALEWVPRVRHAERDRFEKAAREDGATMAREELMRFEITESAASGELVRRSDADYYYPVYFVEPAAGNEKALGFDLSSDPVRAWGLRKAEDTGLPAATPPIQLVQDSGEERSILIFWPVFRGEPRELLGFAVGVLRIAGGDDLVVEALANHDRSGLVVEVMDESDDGWPEWHYVIPPPGMENPVVDASLDEVSASIEVAQRQWSFRVRATPQFAALHKGRVPPLFTLLSGLAITGLLAMLYYATVHREQVSADRRFREVVEAFPQGVLLIDPTGVIRLANQASQVLLGRDGNEILNRPVEQFIPKSGGSGGGGGPGGAGFDPGSLGGEPEVLRVSGESVPVEIGSAVVDTADGPQTLLVVADITQRKEAEERRAQYEEELERSNRDLADFAYVASHDLSEPLRVVSSYCDLLTDQLKGRIDPKGRRYLTHISDASSRMRRLISGLLDLSRVSTRGRPLEPVSLAEVVDEVLSNLDVAVKHKKAVVTSSPDLPVVFADRGQLLQVFQNLVGNALKFSSEGARIDISAQVSPRDANWFEISVSDDGPGISEKDHERVFKVFERLSQDGEISGTGLGLAICRRIVKRHGGQIWVESDRGKGARFLFTLRSTPPPFSPVNSEASTGDSGRNCA